MEETVLRERDGASVKITAVGGDMAYGKSTEHKKENYGKNSTRRWVAVELTLKADALKDTVTEDRDDHELPLLSRAEYKANGQTIRS